ncbi:MAG TPA: DUF1727 domain-containing protein [Eubacteriaceae bacterium]|nr:DUF1727 domain-containing protein [Eubacteriaceae bacterium]
MKPIRFYLAMILARFSYIVLKILGKNATQFPGVIAMKVCPNILRYLEVSDKVIAITGTNGKTTTTNMIASFLTAQGIDLVANNLGSNIEGGIISALLNSTTFFGRNHKEMAVLEVDERSSPYIFPYINPDIIVITNLFRDSYKRNADVEFILSILEKSIPKSSLLILNAEDPLSSNLCKDNPRKYFSIAPQEFEEEVSDNIIKDLVYCPSCGNKLIFDFNRYHHIGFVHCERCDYASPTADYLIWKIHEDQIIIKEGNNYYPYQSEASRITDNYNKIAVISVLREMGYNHEDIANYFNKIKVVSSRYSETIVKNKRVISMLAKAQNPVANSLAFDFIRKQKSWGSISLILMNETYTHKQNFNSIENMAWIYDADYEYLNIPSIKKILCMGQHNLECKIRLLFAGIDEDKIQLLEPSYSLDITTDTDTTIIIHGAKNIAVARQFKDMLVRRIKDEN